MMVVFRQLLVWVLYAVILIKPLLTSKIDGDYIVYNETTSFDTTLRILDEIRCESCLPCFKQTKNWREPDICKQYSKKDNQEICKPLKCSFQGKCIKFQNDNCYSWTITVISLKQKYVLFSHINASSDRETDLNVTCVDIGTAHQTSKPTKSTLQPTVVNTDSVTKKTRRNKEENETHKPALNTLQSTVVNKDPITDKTKNQQKMKTDLATSKETSTTAMKEYRPKTSTSNNGMFYKKDQTNWPTRNTLVLQPTVVNTDSFTMNTRQNKQESRSDRFTGKFVKTAMNEESQCLILSQQITIHMTCFRYKICAEQLMCLNSDCNQDLSPRPTKNTLQPTVANTNSVIGKAKNKQKKASTTGMKELQLNNEMTDQEGSGNIAYKDDDDNGIGHSCVDLKCQRKCRLYRKCMRKQKDCPTAVDAGKQMHCPACVDVGKQKDCPACVDVGILFITHVIAAVIGAGILYVIQIIKKYKGKRNDESNRKSNEEMVNVAYGLTRGVDILQTSNVNHQEEAIYNEVDDKPCTVMVDHTSSNCSTGSTSNNRKHSKLPDIPNENEKDESYLLPQTPKDPLLPDVSDKVKTPIYLVPEELSSKDLIESNQGTEHDAMKNCGQETIVTDTGDDYFVLQKTDNMDLK